MEITYEYPTTDTKTVSFDEEDLAALTDILRESFVDRLRVIGLSYPCNDYEAKLIEMCNKYNVNHESKLEVTGFFRAVLGVS